MESSYLKGIIYDPKQAQELSKRYSLPRQVIVDVLSKNGITPDAFICSENELKRLEAEKVNCAKQTSILVEAKQGTEAVHADFLMVKLISNKDEYQALLLNLDEKVYVDYDVIKDYPILFDKPVFVEFKLGVEYYSKNLQRYKVTWIKPVQNTLFDTNQLDRIRNKCSLNQWIDHLVKAMGFEVQSMDFESKMNAQLPLLLFCASDFFLLALGDVGYSGFSGLFSYNNIMTLDLDGKNKRGKKAELHDVYLFKDKTGNFNNQKETILSSIMESGEDERTNGYRQNSFSGIWELAIDDSIMYFSDSHKSNYLPSYLKEKNAMQKFAAIVSVNELLEQNGSMNTRINLGWLIGNLRKESIQSALTMIRDRFLFTDFFGNGCSDVEHIVKLSAALCTLFYGDLSGALTEDLYKILDFSARKRREINHDILGRQTTKILCYDRIMKETMVLMV